MEAVRACSGLAFGRVRRRCFVCTAPSSAAAAAVGRESCTFLDSAAAQNCRFLGKKSEKWSKKLGRWWRLRRGRLPQRWGVEIKCRVIPQLELETQVIVIDIFSAVLFTFHISNFNLVKLFGLSTEMEIIPVVKALKPDNCIFRDPVKSRSAKNKGLRF